MRAQLARVLPEFGDAAPLDRAERARFCNAIGAVLRAARGHVEGVVLDDLHFADEASVELLQYVCRRHAAALGLRRAARGARRRGGARCVEALAEPASAPPCWRSRR